MTNNQGIDISVTIKRLELIKNLIALQEDEMLVANIEKLQSGSINDELKNIIDLLKGKAYGRAVALITTYINSYNQVTTYIDPEVEALKLEAKLLEAGLKFLSDEKADAEKLIYEFSVRHNSELGELILKILDYKKQKAKGTPQQEEAEKDYSDFDKEYEIRKDEKVLELSDDEKKELKDKYRKASKLCHPDVVSDEQKELANKLFSELNLAYESNNLEKVREILSNLEQGNFFVSKSDAINEKKILKGEIENLRLRIKELRNQINAIKESETYKTVISIDNWNEYFNKTKQKLTAQLKEFEVEQK